MILSARIIVVPVVVVIVVGEMLFDLSEMDDCMDGWMDGVNWI